MMNKKILLLMLLMANFALSVNAQKLVSGGTTKLFKTENGVKTYEIKFPNNVFVRKAERENDGAENGKFYVGVNGKAFEAGDASNDGASSADNSFKM